MTPIATEKVLRGILRSLVVGGYYTSSIGEDTLSALPANASDADISNAANSFTYNAAVITGVSTTDIISDTSLNIWVDADSTNGVHYDYFRVGMRGTTSADITKYTEVATILRPFSGGPAPSPTTYMTLGPRTALLDNTDTSGYDGVLSLGSYWSGTAKMYGYIGGGSTALNTNHASLGLGGLGIHTEKNIEFRAGAYTTFVDSATNATRGGFYGLSADTATLFVGDYPSILTASLQLGKEAAPSNNFKLYHSKDGNYLTLFYRSAENVRHSACLSLNGDTAGYHRNPLTFGNVGTGGAPALSVFGTENAGAGGDNVVTIVSMEAAGYTQSVTRILTECAPSANFNFISMASWTGAAYTPVFRVNGLGVAYAPNFVTPYSDLAEWMLTDAPHDPGSVLVMRNGIAVLSDAYEATGVVGVVSSQPGLVMNGLCEGKENHVRVAKSGMVPVFFSTEFGDVEGNGELLCAGPGGYAVRAPEIPRPGSIVGKAMSAMSSYHGDDVCGVIQMLVC